MSTLKVTTLSNLAGTGPATLNSQYAAKAWCQCVAAGTINDSANVASVTDGATGINTVNLSSAMVDTNQAAFATVWNASYNRMVNLNYSNGTNFTAQISTNAGALTDANADMSFNTLGDLA